MPEQNITNKQWMLKKPEPQKNYCNNKIGLLFAMNTLTLKVPLYAVGQASTAVWDGDFGSVDSFRTFFLSPQNMDVKNAPNDKLIIHQPPVTRGRLKFL